jgi:hypothetical protein
VTEVWCDMVGGAGVCHPVGHERGGSRSHRETAGPTPQTTALRAVTAVAEAE